MIKKKNKENGIIQIRKKCLFTDWGRGQLKKTAELNKNKITMLIKIFGLS
jgi:hypothetical protein